MKSELDRQQEYLEKHVSESFNLFQATIAIIAIFNGFVFSALFQLLINNDKLTDKKLIVWLLALAMLFFTFALVLFHASAHRVIKYWGIFSPRSIFSKLGSIMVDIGIFSMLSCIAMLLFYRRLNFIAWFVEFGAIALFLFGLSFRRMHHKRPYLINVDVEDRSHCESEKKIRGIEPSL